MACICLLATPRAEGADADTPSRYDIPSLALDEALTRFAEQSGASLGMPGSLPRVRSHAITGRFTAGEALQALLAGTGLQARRLGPRSFRLETAPLERESTPDASAGPEALTEVVVTGAKRAQDGFSIPVSLAVIDGDTGREPGPLQGSRAVLSLEPVGNGTRLGPGRNRLFIRGVADSPFVGPTQGTVSVQFDESRMTYDGPDPDLQLLDVDRVEILEGPQGPLYGTGALGGVYHIVPRAPDLQALELRSGVHWTSVAHGGSAPGADAVLNAPLLAGRLALRAAVYGQSDPGWIDDTDGRADVNSTRVRGARLALRGALAGEWTADLQGIAQSTNTADSQYLLQRRWPLRRSGVLPEPQDNDLRFGAFTARGPFLGQQALVTVSRVQHEVDATQDAGAAAGEWGAAAPLRYSERRRYGLWNQELRLWGEQGGSWSWLAGASRLYATSDLGGLLAPDSPGAREVLRLARRVSESAIFGEVTAPLPAMMRATVGLRVFDSSVEDSSLGRAEGEDTESSVRTATPSFAVDHRSADGRAFYFLRYARALRPGGLNPAREPGRNAHFEADELSNVDLGARWAPDDALRLQASVFATAWSHIQSDVLAANGLVGTRNVGDARNAGAEMRVEWAMDEAWKLGLSGIVQHARLRNASVPVDDDPRLPVVPDLRVHAFLARSLPLGSWQGTLRLDGDYTGSSRLSFEQALDRRTGGFAVADLQFEAHRGPLALTLQLSNLFDSHADTFAFGNPFSLRRYQQYTPLQPRTLTLGASYSPAR